MADTNNLWADPRFTNGMPATLPFASDTNANPIRARVLGALGKMVKVKLRRGTRLIDIAVTHRVPELTDAVANSIVSEYLKETAQREDTTIGLASQSLAKEADLLRKKLEESENALQAYKEETQASSLDDRENTVVAKLKELSTKATEAKSDRIKTETEYNQALSLGKNVEALLKVPSIAKDSVVLALQLNLTKAQDDFAALCKRYKEKHPKYIQATTLIGELKGDITNAVLSSVQTLKAGLDSARAAEESLNEAMKTQETAALELSKLSIQYSVLTRELESDRALYDAVLKGMKEADVTKETQQTGIVHVVEPAITPDLPVWPKRAAVLAISGLAGIFFGLLIIMGLSVSDTSIKTVDDAETRLHLSVFSAVPQVRGVKRVKTHLVVVERAKSSGAEAFRTLRTSLSMLGKAEERRVFLFTSAMPSEGKTFCSLNYSASLAQLGLKTLLIDADMRRPSIEATLMGRDTKQPGLTDYLTGQKKFEEVAQPTKLENLLFVSGGAVAASPAELLAKDGLERIIKEALLHYDRVVLDSAPINAVSDTLLMLRSVQTVCLVVRAASTSARYVLRCVHSSRARRGPSRASSSTACLTDGASDTAPTTITATTASTAKGACMTPVELAGGWTQQGGQFSVKSPTNSILQHPNASHPWWLRAAKALAVGYIVASQVLVDVAGSSYMAFGLGVSLAGLIAAGSLFGVWQPKVRKWTRVQYVFLCYCLLRSFSGVKDSHPWEAFASLLSAFLGGISIAAALQAGVRFRSLVYGLLASNVLQIAIILLGIGPEPPPGADTFRYAGITGNANELALQLTLGACLIWLMPKRAGLVPCLCAFGFVAFAVAATGSRKAILIAVFFIALVVVHALEKAPKKRRGLLGALAIVGLCLIGLCLAPRIAEQARDILAVQRSLDYEDHSFQTRANLVEEGLRLWEAAPLLGHGLDASRGLASEDTYAHNNYVESAVRHWPSGDAPILCDPRPGSYLREPFAQISQALLPGVSPADAGRRRGVSQL